jgi:hypothetical protein
MDQMTLTPEQIYAVVERECSRHSVYEYDVIKHAHPLLYVAYKFGGVGILDALAITRDSIFMTNLIFRTFVKPEHIGLVKIILSYAKTSHLEDSLPARIAEHHLQKLGERLRENQS